MGFDGVCRVALTADANESFDAEVSGLIVIGFDNGDGLLIRFAASVEEARGGMFTSLGWSCFNEVDSAAANAIAAVEVDVDWEDGAGFAVLVNTLASRLA